MVECSSIVHMRVLLPTFKALLDAPPIASLHVRAVNRAEVGAKHLEGRGSLSPTLHHAMQSCWTPMPSIGQTHETTWYDGVSHKHHARMAWQCPVRWLIKQSLLETQALESVQAFELKDIRKSFC